jgi:hypothetical protein
MKIVYFFVSICALMGCSILWSSDNRFSTQFERLDCSSPPGLKYNAAVWDNRISVLIWNETDTVYKLDLSSSFLFIREKQWSTPLTDTHADRASSTFIAIPYGKYSITLYPKSLIVETDDEWHDVRWALWPCQSKEHSECEVELDLAFVRSDGPSAVCKLKATLLAKIPKATSQSWK